MATEAIKAQIPLDIQVLKDRNSLTLYIENPDVKTEDEFLAIFSDWPEQFGGDEHGHFMNMKYASAPSPRLKHYHLTLWPRTRRQFAVLPAIIRKALKLGYRVYYQRDDEHVPIYRDESLIDLEENAAIFWQAIALAQMWYEKP